MRNWIFVRVETDQDGLFGWGEATLEWKTRAVAGAIEDLAPLIDRTRSARHREARADHEEAQLLAPRRHRHERHLGHRDRALGYLGQDLFRFRCGGCSGAACATAYGSIRISASATCARSMKPSRPNQLIERAHDVLARGYRAMKVVIIPYTHYSATLPQVDRTARMMAALRDAVGPDIEIMVDFHGRPASAGAALAYIDAIEPARPMFVEEVLPPGDSLGLREVASKTNVPIATGERLVDLRRIRRTVSQPRRQHRAARHLPLRRFVGDEEDRRDGRGRRDRRRSAQSDRPDRRRRRAALRRIDVKPCRSRKKWSAPFRGISMSCTGRSRWSTASGRFRPSLDLGSKWI